MAKKSSKGCRCPEGSTRISTKGRGRGWACMSKKASKGWFKPFVKAIGCK